MEIRKHLNDVLHDLKVLSKHPGETIFGAFHLPITLAYHLPVVRQVRNLWLRLEIMANRGL